MYTRQEHTSRSRRLKRKRAGCWRSPVSRREWFNVTLDEAIEAIRRAAVVMTGRVLREAIKERKRADAEQVAYARVWAEFAEARQREADKWTKSGLYGVRFSGLALPSLIARLGQGKVRKTHRDDTRGLAHSVKTPACAQSRCRRAQ